MKKAFIAMLVSALFAAPVAALANTSTSVNVGGGNGTGQNNYLQTTSAVKLTVNPACTSLGVSDVNFGGVDVLSNPTDQTLSISEKCVAGAQMAFQFNGGNAGTSCNMVNGSSSIAYQVLSSADSKNYCTAGAFSNAGPATPSSSTAPTFSVHIVSQIPDSIPSGSYSDVLTTTLYF